MNEVLYTTRYFSLENDAHGITFVRGGDAVMIVPVTAEGDVLLAVEPSAAFDEPTWVLPAGEIEDGETHAETANRELQEEIGFKAGRLDALGEIRPWSKYIRARVFLFLARDLEPSRLEGDEDYDIGVERVSLDAFETLVREGALLDAGVIAALALARSFLEGAAD